MVQIETILLGLVRRHGIFIDPIVGMVAAAIFEEVLVDRGSKTLGARFVPARG
jgi:hypothetical protein